MYMLSFKKGIRNFYNYVSLVSIATTRRHHKHLPTKCPQDRIQILTVIIIQYNSSLHEVWTGISIHFIFKKDKKKTISHSSLKHDFTTKIYLNRFSYNLKIFSYFCTYLKNNANFSERLWVMNLEVRNYRCYAER